MTNKANKTEVTEKHVINSPELIHIRMIGGVRSNQAGAKPDPDRIQEVLDSCGVLWR